METPLEQRTPGQLAEYLLVLSSEYGQLIDELSKILERKDILWFTFRDLTSSDKQAEMKWMQTDEGKRERQIQLALKKLTLKISVIKKYLSIKTEEARNTY